MRSGTLRVSCLRTIGTLRAPERRKGSDIASTAPTSPLPAGSPARASGFRRQLPLFLVEVVGCLAIGLLQPPAPVPEDAPLDEFSSARAWRHVEAIARSPHPVGSAEHDAVLHYLEGALVASGVPLPGEVQSGEVGGTPLRNLAARIPGTRGDRAVLLVAHYDSAPGAPGAADDAAGVAAILETARALRHRPPIQNDVIILFTDGEEPGLLGARLFVEKHPWARDVGLVLNFEARGNCGPSILFETSEGNGRLIREAAEAAPRLVASSLAYAVYKRMPNDTDLTVFKRAGMPGLNFAFIGGLPAYHTALDTPANLDERSLQHHGSYALSLATRFGNLDLRQLGDRDAVYFDVAGRLFLHYPGHLSGPFTAALALAYGLIAVAGLRRGCISVKGVLRGARSWAGDLVETAGAAALGAWLIAKGLQLALSTPVRLPWGAPWAHALFVVGLFHVTGLLMSRRRRRRAVPIRPAEEVAGFQLLLLAALIVVNVFIEGATFLLAAPFLLSLPALIIQIRMAPFAPPCPRAHAALYVAAFAVAALLFPAAFLLVLALATGVAAPVLVAMVLAAVQLATLLPALERVASPPKAPVTSLGGT